MLALLGADILTLASACTPVPGDARSPDTSQWRIERNKEWGFAVSVPPQWETVDWPSVGSQLIVLQRLPSGPDLRCQVDATPEASTANTDQGRLNAYIILKGPPDPQTVTAVARAKHPNDVITFYPSKLIDLNGYPAYISESSGVMTSTSRPLFDHSLLEAVYVVGKDFSVGCDASYYDRQSSETAYAEYLPVFRAILASFVVLPAD